jgi:hypothetical protein
MSETTRHPHDYRWRDRFPDAAPVVRGEGGALYAAVDGDGKSLWLIKDEGTMADLLPSEDLGSLVSLTRYSARRERGRWVSDAVASRQRFAALRPDRAARRRPTELDGLLSALVDQTARDVAALAVAKGLRKVNERDHLQPRCAATARTLAKSWSPEPAVSTQLEVEFRAWPRLGNVDVALTWPGRLPVLLELKCGDGSNAAGECVWDAAKLAFALQCDRTSDAYLLAGAPVSDWQRPIRGAEFFETGQHDIALLRVLYSDWWRYWEGRDDPQPTELPRSFRTESVHAARFALDGNDWELRLAAVLTDDAMRVPWPRLT